LAIPGRQSHTVAAESPLGGVLPDAGVCPPPAAVELGELAGDPEPQPARAIESAPTTIAVTALRRIVRTRVWFRTWIAIQVTCEQ
jgi:hypothetical protein